MGKERILIVDDSPETLEMVRRTLAAKDYRVFTSSNVADAIRFFEKSSVDLLITDLRMPNVSGLELVRHVRENHRDTEVMMITGFATVEGAVEGAEGLIIGDRANADVLAAMGPVSANG